MFRQSYILFKEFLPKQIQLQKLLARQTLNLNSLAKSAPKQLKNTSLHQFKSPPLTKELVQFTKPYSQQHFSSKKVLKLKSRVIVSNLSSAKITQHSSRSEHQFMDDNVWKNLSQSKSKKFEDLTKDIPRRINKPHMAVIFKQTKQSTEKENNFVSKNLQALRKIVKSQSEQRHYKQMIHFDIINTKRAHLKSNLRENEQKKKLIRRQQKNQLKLKLLSRMAQTKNSPQRMIIHQLKSAEKKSNPEKEPMVVLRQGPADLTASKVVLQRKSSLKKQLIFKIRKERNQRRQQYQKIIKENRKYVSTYLTQGEQQPMTRNLTFQFKRRFNTEHSELDKAIKNNTQKFQPKNKQWDQMSNNPIQPW